MALLYHFAFNVLSLHQKLASQVDTLAEYKVNDVGTGHYLQRFLGSDEHAMTLDEARESLLCRNEEPPASNMHLTAAAGVIFRYRLLDIVADIVGCPEPDGHTRVERGPRPGCSNVRLSRVSNSKYFLFSPSYIQCRCTTLWTTGQI